ncbi:hypothetical protein DPMN_003731 [Dreissena polymorpha]|uniref:Uncharacterized protein n=1 Tax=Dreissena polymorpha TaxID=45954 RepID=A0A9D4RSW8_DREPO|nr:hypothetical protein DPMN_003731 [Dreissena polymorpha]
MQYGIMEFKEGTEECSLVVILDSLDQLDTSHNGRSLMWLPASLPPHCKIIVSSLPEEKYEKFPALKHRVSGGVCIVTKRKQLLVTSRFDKNVKLYTITNGCVDAIIKTGYKEEIYQVVISFYTFLHSMP